MAISFVPRIHDSTSRRLSSKTRDTFTLGSGLCDAFGCSWGARPMLVSSKGAEWSALATGNASPKLVPRRAASAVPYLTSRSSNACSRRVPSGQTDLPPFRGPSITWDNGSDRLPPNTLGCQGCQLPRSHLCSRRRRDSMRSASRTRSGSRLRSVSRSRSY